MWVISSFWKLKLEDEGVLISLEHTTCTCTKALSDVCERPCVHKILMLVVSRLNVWAPVNLRCLATGVTFPILFAPEEPFETMDETRANTTYP